MISKVVSTDIIKYLLKTKGMTIENIAEAMDTTVPRIKNINKNKETFIPQDINTYVKSSDIHFWEFIIEAVPLNHLSEKARNRVLVCKELSEKIKKNKK